MLSLHDAQGNFVDTINDGPDRLHPTLFAGPIDRIMLGLKAHANTISHARLIALEETFPLTLDEVGQAEFNALSRAYCETAEARSSDINDLGKGMIDFLGKSDVKATIFDLASIEWAWLESYHAADADALDVADLAGFDGAALLELRVAPHPSARLVVVHAPLASVINELAGQQPAAILTVRPEAEVRVVALDRLQLAFFARTAQDNCTLGNLILVAIEQELDTDPLEPVLKLIGAGALVIRG